MPSSAVLLEKSLDDHSLAGKKKPRKKQTRRHVSIQVWWQDLLGCVESSAAKGIYFEGNMNRNVTQTTTIFAMLLAGACSDPGNSTDLFKGLLDGVTASMGQPNYWYPTPTRPAYSRPARATYVQPSRPVYYNGASANCAPGPGACASR